MILTHIIQQYNCLVSIRQQPEDGAQRQVVRGVMLAGEPARPDLRLARHAPAPQQAQPRVAREPAWVIRRKFGTGTWLMKWAFMPMP